jgi:hypothetical protein
MVLRNFKLAEFKVYASSFSRTTIGSNGQSIPYALAEKKLALANFRITVLDSHRYVPLSCIRRPVEQLRSDAPKLLLSSDAGQSDGAKSLR